jgi:hypothetical protein
VRFSEKSADHPSLVGMVAKVMPGDGVSGHKIRVYQRCGMESNLGPAIGSDHGFVVGSSWGA